MKFIKNLKLPDFIFFLIVLIIFSWFINELGNIYKSIEPFNGFPINGAFQLFNPMRRIDVGQRGGVEFQFFHGIGIPYLHYPLFSLLGSSIFASEISRFLLSLFTFIFSTLIFYYKLSKSFKISLIFFGLSILLVNIFNIDFLYKPGNSLLGIRTFAPIIFFGYFSITELNNSFRLIFLGFVLSLSVLLGIEHGLVLIGSLVLSIILLFIITKQFILNYLLYLFKILISFLLCYTSLMIVISGFEGFLKSIKYNFFEVPIDQMWYFGSPPNPFISSLKDLLADKTYIISLIIVFLLIIYTIKQISNSFKSNDSLNYSFFITILIMELYAIFSTISYFGIQSFTYIAPLKRIIILIVIIIVYKELKVKFHELFDYSSKNFVNLFSSVLLVLTFLSFYNSIENFKNIFSHKFFHLGEGWTNALGNYVSVIDLQVNKSENIWLWSTYSNLLNSHFSVFNASDDYIIHALGPEGRKLYLDSFITTKPEYVETIRNSFTGYEEWIRNSSWDFYETLLLNYHIVSNSHHSLLWKRNDSTYTFSEDKCKNIKLDSKSNSVLITENLDNNNKILIVELEYNISNPYQKIPFIGNFPRYLIFTNPYQQIPISLASYEQSRTFFIYNKGTTIQLDFITKSLLPGASFEVQKICVREPSIFIDQRFFE